MATQSRGPSDRSDDGGHRHDDHPERTGTLYDVLGISPAADAQQIRRAYRRRVRDSHPDLGGSSAQFQQVQHAFDVLNDESARADYDRSLREAGSESPGAAGAAYRDDRSDWGGYGRGTFTAGARGSGQGTERTGDYRPSGMAHQPPVYRPELSDTVPLSLTLTSQRVHGEIAGGGLAGLFGGGSERRLQRMSHLLERHVLGELPAARLFQDVTLAVPQLDRKGRPKRSQSAPRAEQVVVCGDVLVVVGSVEVPATTASWDGRVLRSGGRSVTVPDVVAQARMLREVLLRRDDRADGRTDDRTDGHRPLSVHGQVVLLAPDGSLMSPVVETIGHGAAAPGAAARAMKNIVAALAASPQANVVDRHLLATLREQLVRPDGA
ncbi:J domain-containing protein [Nesterenkonia aerolata]|uniref:DnaJ domain-containing protein n=1 Tax=Nesterenkonia aerolata TaxID=3074079 RepID=A0ABU2DNR0_9MICC|nr:DnaJ domain-containing protein [Nesterenkonia sp. LY-0111]MDR8018121.1 DnaJ domain-containing protein [Nesterenkonia sp. LY-0111]